MPRPRASTQPRTKRLPAKGTPPPRCRPGGLVREYVSCLAHRLRQQVTTFTDALASSRMSDDVLLAAYTQLLVDALVHTHRPSS